MDQNKNNDIEIEVDPDYESTYEAIRNVELKEEEENKLTEGKLRKIIQEEFDKELHTRQKQLELIEEKVFRAQKLLHVVRYVLISAYYHNKALECESTGNSSIECTNLLTGQNRIHPAVKKLLGSNVNSLKFLTARTKRKVPSKIESYISSQPEPKKLKLDSQSRNELVPGNQVKLDSVKSLKIEEIVTNRKKTQHRVVIGNISYFKKSLEQDNMMHKWMVYVKIFRGPKDGPEVSNLIISKVIFYLHPSYKPHDVVEICHPPYHLSRRGWGEFPLRVQIVFKSTMNKPVDIIHKLKLDKTFSERQTLGNETVVPIFLYDETVTHSKIEPKNVKLDVKDDPEKPTSYSSNISFPVSTDSVTVDQINDIKWESASTCFEHNYCYENISAKQENDIDINDCNLTETPIEENSNTLEENSNYCVGDHSYCLPYCKEGEKNSGKKNTSTVRQAYNELIYGLGSHYLDPIRSRNRNVKHKVVEKMPCSSEKSSRNVFKILKTVTGQSIRFLPESFSQVLLSNGNIVQVKFLKQSQNSVQKVNNNRILINLQEKLKSVKNSEVTQSNCGNCLKEIIKNEKYLLKIPKHRFKNMGEVLPYLFKRMPLWTAQANDIEYKCTYPFSARSKKEYDSWHMGKKLSAEWSRAKTMKKILLGEPYSEKWNTKAIFMYGRSHLYTPVVHSYRLFSNKSLETDLISDCFANSANFRNGYSSEPRLLETDESINIASPVKDLSESQPIENNFIDISDRGLIQECAFVKDAALDCGVVLKHEELIKGVAMNASERVMFEAVKNFAESLIRRSRHHLVCQGNYDERTAVITTNEIRKALKGRKEFSSIKKFQESKIAMDFFS